MALSLLSPVGATSPHSGDPGHSSASAPGLSRGLVAGIHVDAVRLAPVLSDLIVDGGHDVRPHGGPEDGREADRRAGASVLLIVDSDLRASRGERHFLQRNKIERSGGKGID